MSVPAVREGLMNSARTRLKSLGSDVTLATMPYDCDVIVVGSGAGGATFAYACARAGKTVLLLERGRNSHDQSRSRRTGDAHRRKALRRPADRRQRHSQALYYGRRAGRRHGPFWGSTLAPRQRRFSIPAGNMASVSRERSGIGRFPTRPGTLLHAKPRASMASPAAGTRILARCETRQRLCEPASALAPDESEVDRCQQGRWAPAVPLAPRYRSRALPALWPMRRLICPTQGLEAPRLI